MNKDINLKIHFYFQSSIDKYGEHICLLEPLEMKKARTSTAPSNSDINPVTTGLMGLAFINSAKILCCISPDRFIEMRALASQSPQSGEDFSVLQLTYKGIPPGQEERVEVHLIPETEETLRAHRPLINLAHSMGCKYLGRQEPWET